MLLATVGTDEDLRSRVGEPSIFFGGHVLDAFINEIEIDFMTGAESSLG
jgi:hypothetical protein